MLSHKNIASNLMDISSVLKVREDDRFLSFLPLHHTFECTTGFLLPLSVGASIAFCDGIRHIAENIKNMILHLWYQFQFYMKICVKK